MNDSSSEEYLCSPEPLAWWWLPLILVGEVVIPLALLAILVGLAVILNEVLL